MGDANSRCCHPDVGKGGLRLNRLDYLGYAGRGRIIEKQMPDKPVEDPGTPLLDGGFDYPPSPPLHKAILLEYLLARPTTFSVMPTST